MQLRFFTVPCIGGEQIEAELNHFLASQKVLTVDRQVVDNNGTPCWACCVSPAAWLGMGTSIPNRVPNDCGYY